jgi:hypothetical protein
MHCDISVDIGHITQAINYRLNNMPDLERDKM